MTTLTVLGLIVAVLMLWWGLRRSEAESTRTRYRRASRAMSRVQSRVTSAAKEHHEPR